MKEEKPKRGRPQKEAPFTLIQVEKKQRGRPRKNPKII
jgi:hypothetical protein